MGTIRYKMFMDYEKEEKWLNEMSAKGLAFTGYYFFGYKFKDCKPGEFTYRIELLENLPSHPKSKEYLDFMAESGVEHTYSWARWVYFRKKTADGPFVIYSDATSLLQHYRGISTLWLAIFFVFIALAVSQLILGVDRMTWDYWSGYLLNLLAGTFALCFGIWILVYWHSLRKKMKKLERARDLRE